MSLPKIVYEIGKINPKYIEEAAEYHRKKPRFKPLLLAAVISVSVCGLTAAAIGIGGLEKLKEYFDSESAKFSDEVPTIDDPALYGADLSDKELSEGEARAVSISSDGHSFFAMIEYALSEKELAAAPDNSSLGFKRYFDNCGGICVGIQPISREDNIFTCLYYSGGITDMPKDGITVSLEGLGYYTGNIGDGFTVISERSLSVNIKKESLRFLEFKKASNTVKVENLNLKAELSSLGLILSCDSGEYSNMVEEHGKKYAAKFLQVNDFVFYMKDGTVYGDGEDYASVSGLFRCQCGWSESGREYFYYGFSAPIDADEILKISVCGETLNFEGT